MKGLVWKSNFYLNYWESYDNGGHFEFFVLKESFNDKSSTFAPVDIIIITGRYYYYYCYPCTIKIEKSFIS